MNTFKTIISSAVLAGLMSGGAMAASDGTAGATSTGTTDISLEVTDLVQISNVSDIALGAYGGTGPLVGESEHCVFRNGGDAYTVTLTSSTGSFTIASPTTLDTIAFTVKVDDDTDASDQGDATYNVASGSLTGSGSTTCGGVDNAAIEVTFAEAALLAVTSAADYAATVTILVAAI